MSTRLPEPGDVVADKYVIERLLGRGGMGVVYVVTHRTTGKHLALKCLLPEYLSQPELVERFLREAQAAGRIEHRHIVDVFDAGRDGSVLYIVMSLLEGTSLTALLEDDSQTVEEMLGILVRAMDGVAAAHALGIVHRDLKPDNIFVCVGPSGRLDDPRVLDFGISKLEDDASHSLTKSGVMMGTPYYMSFEQMNSQRDLDQRVDVYAMGVILYEALAGKLPYVAESTASLAIRMLTQPAQHLAELRPDLPRELCDVVMKAIARERDERHPTMRALIDAIRPFAPLGAGSLVVDGQGTPLRSSRLSELHALGTNPTLTPAPKAQELLRTQKPERSPLQVVTDQELSLRRVSAGSKGLGLIGLLSAAVLMLGLSVWWFGRDMGPPEAQPTTARSGEAVGAAPDKPRRPAAAAPTQTSHSALPAALATPTATPAPPKPAPLKRGGRGNKRPNRQTKAPQPAAAAPQPATAPQPGSEPEAPVVDALQAKDAGAARPAVPDATPADVPAPKVTVPEGSASEVPLPAGEASKPASDTDLPQSESAAPTE